MSGTVHQFGGDWTKDKLNRLAMYLPAYTRIFRANEAAQYLSTHYVDAFAGSGRIAGSTPTRDSTLSLFDDIDARNVETFFDGSARVALQVEPPFDHYLFVEANPSFAQELQNLRTEFPDRANRISVLRGEANSILQTWCRQMNWRRNRAIVFLDPYGMSVNWQTIETIGATRSIDLWLLLPIGQAINRLLTTQGPPSGAWADKLTTFFGTDEWIDVFYRPRLQRSLFDSEEGFDKLANFDIISDYFTERLKTVFKYVPPRPRWLMNSRNVPIFGLYFASWNEAGNNIASYILRR